MKKQLLTELERRRLCFHPGDRVSFGYRRSVLQGTIQRTNPKRALILGDDGDKYQVPYELLTRHSAPQNGRNEQYLEAISQFAHELMAEHGLTGWSFRFDHSTRRAGCCDYAKRAISISFDLARRASETDTKDTILHEIAHALVGRKHNHDAVWRAAAKEIGCSGERCHKLVFSPPRYIVKCENGCWTVTAERRNHRLVCRKCNGKLIYETFAENPGES